MMVSIHTKVAAMLSAQGVDIADREASVNCLAECVAPTPCIAAYHDLRCAMDAAKVDGTAKDVLGMLQRGELVVQ